MSPLQSADEGRREEGEMLFLVSLSRSLGVIHNTQDKISCLLGFYNFQFATEMNENI